jgi:alpha-L-arabinofuranosidase
MYSNGRVHLKVFLVSGLGLLEYLYWCEDLDMQPIMAVWAGECHH